ncbi:MAG TPA: thioredoxin-like domain-containing protein [Fimbriiglobus sp.]|jgi:thiol-disulfide isomerase/thioredoxin
MRSAWILLFGLTSLTGCRLFDDPHHAEPTSRSKEKTPPAAEDRWPDESAPPWAKGAIPTAGSWGDPRDPKFDQAAAGKGLLAGYVVDADGRKAKDVAITIALADAKGTKEQPIVTLADRDGAFMVPNLKPGETYLLTAQMRDNGTVLTGQTYATPPSVHVRVRLKEGNATNSSNPTSPTLNLPAAAPPAYDGIPAPSLPTPTPLSNGSAISAPPLPGTNDTSWSPTGAPMRTLAPSQSHTNVTPPLPGGGVESLPIPSIIPSRPDLNTGLPQPDWRAPAAAVPGPATVAPPPLPRLDPTPGRTGANKPAIQNRFILVDPMGRDRDFPTRQPGTFVLLDFMTTTCVPCMRSTPKMVEFQRKYGGKGLEVIAVACDPMAPGDRRAAAATYARKHGVKNYLIYTEPGPNPGAVQRIYRIEAYPTLVLLDPWGTVLWTGHPNDLAKCERALAAAAH